MLPELRTPVPGPRSRELGAELRRYESRNVTHVASDFPVFWQRARGVNVWDVDGNRFLDLSSAFGVAGLGHGDSRVVNALTDQARQLVHAMGDVHPGEGKVALCRRLSELTFERWGAGEGKVILGNSGFEAVEAALKTALLHSGKPGVIAFTGGYHGLGYGALDVGGITAFREPFRRQLGEFATIVPYPHCYRCPRGIGDASRLEGMEFPTCSTHCRASVREEIEKALLRGEIGAILVEPIQGRGGLIVPPRDFLTLLRRICDEHRLLLIVDEIYTGFNRTGALFACEHFDVIPDIICLGKALTSGFPLSACVGRSEVMDAWPESAGEALHTSTFLGNPMGCAMALASIEAHAAPEMATKVRAKGRRFIESLRRIKAPQIGQVRGIGLMIGAELVTGDGGPDGATAGRLIKMALADGMILLADGPAGNVISFAPPFEISDEEMTFSAQWLQENLTSLPGSIS